MADSSDTVDYYKELSFSDRQNERRGDQIPNKLPDYLTKHCMAGCYQFRNHCSVTGVWRPMQGDFMIERPHATFGVPSIFNQEVDPYPQLEEVEMDKGDYLLVSPQKSGTHLTNEIMRMVINRSAKYDQENKLHSWIDIQPYDKIREQTTSPRILNTHSALSWIPPNFRRSDTKVIFTLRNMKDTFVSYFHHLRKHHSEYAGVDVDSEPTRHLWNMYFDWLLNNQYKNWANYFDVIADAWDNHRSDSNVLFVHFEMIKKTPGIEIERIANHMGLACAPELVLEIAQAIDIEKMRIGKYESEALWRTALQDDSFTMYRKGEIGDWKNWFTVEQNRLFHEKFDEWNKERQIQFIYE